MLGAPSFPPGAPPKRPILRPGYRPSRKSSPTTRGLIGRWAFRPNFKSGTAIRDLTGLKADAVASGSPSALIQGPLGPTYLLNGTSQFYTIPARVWPTTAFSASFWLYYRVDPPNVPGLLDTWTSAASHVQLLAVPGGNLFCRIGNVSSGGSIHIGRSTGGISAGAWHHIAMVWSGGTTSASITVYVDGVRADNADDNSGVFTGASATSLAALVSNQSATASSFLDGSIDEMRIYNRALSVPEVEQLARNPTIDYIQPIDQIWSNLSQGRRNAALTKTLDNITSSSTATVLDTAVVNATIPAITLASTGTVLNTAILNATLGNLTLASATQVTVTGALTQTIDPITIASTGTVKVTGTVSQTIPAITLASTGTVLDTEVVNATVPAITLASTATVLDTAVVNATIAPVTLASTGTVLDTAVVSATIPAITLSSTGTVLDTAVVNKTIDPITTASTGTVLVKAAVSSTIDPITLSSVIFSERPASIKIIGSGGDYTSLQDWVASLAGATFGGDQEAALLNEQFTITGTDDLLNGFTTTPTGRVVVRAATAAETGSVSAKHNGLAGSGARIYRTTGIGATVLGTSDDNVKHLYFKDLELFSDGVGQVNGIEHNGTGFDDWIVENCIVHSLNGAGITLDNATGVGSAIVRNCALWDSSVGSYGISGNSLHPSRLVAENCTAVNSATFLGGSGSPGFWGLIAKNCYAGNWGRRASGIFDFDSSCTLTNCASSDSSGSLGLRSLDPVNQFVSVGGTWDLHLKAGSALEGAGTPLGDVTQDFELGTRDATAPDIGFDEFGTPAATTDNAVLTKTLDNITLSATGTVLVSGTLSQTIAPVTLASTGTVKVTGTLDATIPAITLASTGTVRVTGTVSATIDPVTLASTGTVLDTAVLSKTIDNLTLGSTGTVLDTAVVSKTIANLTLVSAFNAYTPVTLNATIPNLTLSSTGKVRVAGSLVKTIPAITLASTGKITVKAALTKTIGPITLSSTVVNPATITNARLYLQIPKFNIDNPPNSTDVTVYLIEKLREMQQWFDALSEGSVQFSNTAPINPRYGTLRYATGNWATALGGVGLYIYKESGWTHVA